MQTGMPDKALSGLAAGDITVPTSSSSDQALAAPCLTVTEGLTDTHLKEKQIKTHLEKVPRISKPGTTLDRPGVKNKGLTEKVVENMKAW